MGLFDRLKERLQRTRATLSDGISGLFRGGRPIDARSSTSSSSCSTPPISGAVAAEVTAELARAHGRGELKGEEDVRRALRDILVARLGFDGGEIVLAHRPTVILVVGVNGSGKTTTIAKLAHRFQARGKRVLVGAGDTFRAAAADQLEIWAQRSGFDIVRQKASGADPAAVAYDARRFRASRAGTTSC